MKTKLSFFSFLLFFLVCGCKLNLLPARKPLPVNTEGECSVVLVLNESETARAITKPDITNNNVDYYKINITHDGNTKTYDFENKDVYNVSVKTGINTFEITGYKIRTLKDGLETKYEYATPVYYLNDDVEVDKSTVSLQFTVKPIIQTYTTGELAGVSDTGTVSFTVKMPSLDVNKEKIKSISCNITGVAQSVEKDLTEDDKTQIVLYVGGQDINVGTYDCNIIVKTVDNQNFLYSQTVYCAMNLITRVLLDFRNETFSTESCGEIGYINFYKENEKSINLIEFDDETLNYTCYGIDYTKNYFLELTMKVAGQKIDVSIKKDGDTDFGSPLVINTLSGYEISFVDENPTVNNNYIQKLKYPFGANQNFWIGTTGDSEVKISVSKGGASKDYIIKLSPEVPVEPEDVEVSHPVDVSAMTALPDPVTELTETNYVITNEAQLFALGTYVNGGGETTGKTFVLGKDIKLTQDWVPIGNTSKPFEGTFEGNNYKVAGININGDFTDAGFIGRVDSAVVQNLTVEGSIVCSSGNYRTAGIITNSQGETKILNCINLVNVTGDRHVGGILAQAETGTVIIENCINFGDITVGYSHGAGIVGYVSIGPDSVIVNNCANYGTISGDYPLAGIGFSYGNISINNCINNGNVAPNSGAAYGAIGYKSGGDLTVQHSAYLSGSAGTKTSIGSDPDPDTVSSYTHTSGKMGCTLTTAIGSTTDVKEMLNSASEIGTSYNRWIYTTNETYYGLPMFADTIARLNAEPEEPENLLKALYSSPQVLNKIPEAGKTYKISTEDDLIYLRTLTDAENQCSGVVFEQTDPITLSGINWNPIGSGVTTSKNRFSGTYDGKGFKISNLNIDTSVNYAGLFGYCFKAKIQNLIVEGQITSTANNYVGGIVAFMAGSNADSLIENCISNVKIESSSKYVGGICGNLTYGIIRNCVNIGDITCLNETADLYGGITGTNNAYIYNCVNLGNISGATGFGGISGNNGTRMLNCYNAGTVNLNELSSSTSFGGITGASYNSSSNQNCFTKKGMCSTSYQGSTPDGSIFTDVSELITALDGFDWDGASLDSTDYNSWNTYTYNGFPVCVDCSKVNNP